MTKRPSIKHARTYFIAFLIIVNLISFESNAQSLTEKLGGVKTDFIFISDSAEMNIVDQAILKRGFSNYGSYSDGAYGYGFQTFYLEFMTTSKIKERYSKNRKLITHYKIDFLTKNDSLLSSFTLYSSGVIKISSRENLQTYSINLYKIPIILLERTKKIRIEHYSYKFK